MACIIRKIHDFPSSGIASRRPGAGRRARPQPAARGTWVEPGEGRCYTGLLARGAAPTGRGQGENRTIDAPSYQQIDQRLQDAAAGVSAAELHGSLCGQLSASPELPGSRWFAVATGEALAPGELSSGTMALLDELFAWTVAGFDGMGFEFQPLLPDDAEPLAERAAALALWCSGFLAALGQIGLKDPERLPDEAGEFVRDLAEMSKVGLGDHAATEADEAAYQELVEYLRVGAMVLYETLRGPDGETVLH